MFLKKKNKKKKKRKKKKTKNRRISIWYVQVVQNLEKSWFWWRTHVFRGFSYSLEKKPKKKILSKNIFLDSTFCRNIFQKMPKRGGIFVQNWYTQNLSPSYICDHNQVARNRCFKQDIWQGLPQAKFFFGPRKNLSWKNFKKKKNMGLLIFVKDSFPMVFGTKKRIYDFVGDLVP